MELEGRTDPAGRSRLSRRLPRPSADAYLEILPKIEAPIDGAGGPSQALIRRRLIHMLAVALDLDVSSGQMTKLGWQREDLLEILVGLFARKLVDAVRTGLPRRYIAQEDDLPVLRGRLDAVKQLTMRATAPHRLACRFDALSPNISLNQVMKAVIAKLSSLARSTENQRLLRELAFAYSDVADVSASGMRWDEIIIDRTNRRWHDLVVLANLLLGGRYQTTTNGDGQGFALLFEMNTLFEEYVARILARALTKEGLTFQRKDGRRCCLVELEGAERPRFRTIPDVLVKRGSELLFVADTKWKQLSTDADDPKRGVAQADVYQMLAYGRVYGCPHLVLIYPHHAGLGTTPITARYRVAGCDDVLTVATVDIGAPQGMVERLAVLFGGGSSLGPTGQG